MCRAAPRGGSCRPLRRRLGAVHRRRQLDLQQDLGGQWYQRLRYNHQERQGFAPISVDYAGRQDNLWWQLVQARTDHSRLELSTGYDLVGSFWQDVQLSAEYMPSRSTKLALQGDTTCVTNRRGRWGWCGPTCGLRGCT